MSILIKGMDMPNKTEIGTYSIAVVPNRPGSIAITQKNRRLECFELVEIPTPHGQLIDREELLKLIKEYDYHFGTEIEHGRCVSFSRTVLEMPTIIEGES